MFDEDSTGADSPSPGISRCEAMTGTTGTMAGGPLPAACGSAIARLPLADSV